jgi:hypothetical protein
MYPSFKSSTKGERWGGRAWPGLYGCVGKKCKLFSESTIHYGYTYSLFVCILTTSGLSITWCVTLLFLRNSSSSSVANTPPNDKMRYYRLYIGVSLFNKKTHFENRFLYLFCYSSFLVNFFISGVSLNSSDI